MKKEIAVFSRNLRNNPTDAERHLWKYLARRQIEGLKFRRQAPIGRYVADFVCFERKVIVELDGSQHSESVKDRERDKWLTGQGFTVLRFWDNEVFQNTEGVLELIRLKILSPHLNPLPLHSPPPQSSPIKGEEDYGNSLNQRGERR
ncbi:hypothetical protein AUJ67_03670 [Candidatus Desantisbacteria bacterium CG1_02_49_89]|nr:MAG: hypothetical protein AUJ67_03670 [Candidatus Desantisbacteria bacterium CG1_02_49_89]